MARRPLIRCQGKGGILHVQWFKDLLLEVLTQTLPTDCFNNAAHPIKIDPVLPLFTWVEESGSANASPLPSRVPGIPFRTR
ncbi:MAG: hypothetical protein R2932_12315 [Caldilineaceae bacterium]